MRKIFLLIILITISALAGCRGTPNKAVVTGVIAHNHQMEIPVGYVITVQIVDITKVDPSGKGIAQTRIESQGAVLPMPFEVTYDPGQIKSDHIYSMQIMIVDDSGKLLYSNTAVVPVITNGNPAQNVEVDVVLING